MIDNNENNNNKEDFEKIQKNKDDEMANMQFAIKRIEFYPEDLKKMESMPHEEKMEYVKKLRQEKKYIEIND